MKNSHAAAHKEAMDAKEVKDNSTKQPSEVRHVLPVSQPILGEAMACSQPYDWKGKKWNELTDSITYCTAKDLLPVNTVERSGFRKIG